MDKAFDPSCLYTVGHRSDGCSRNGARHVPDCFHLVVFNRKNKVGQIVVDFYHYHFSSLLGVRLVA